MSVLAKSDPDVCLRDHLADVDAAIKCLLTPARLSAFTRIGVSKEQAADLVSRAAWFHDFGKATVQWQERLREKRKLPQHAMTSFFSVLWAYGLPSPEEIDALPPERLAVALAVLAHHGQLHQGVFAREHYTGEKISLIADEWDRLVSDLPWQTARAPLPSKPVQAEKICTMVETVKTVCLDHARRMPFRGLYCLILTLLVSADHAVSGGLQLSERKVSYPNMPGEPTDFQSEVRFHPSEVLCAVAGCGSGKTAAALLRAAELADRACVDRVVLCLPSRFTSNSMMRDLVDTGKYGYPRGHVGLVHSEALQVLQSLDLAVGKERNEEEQDYPGTPEEEFSKAVRYEHPVTVSTVDHLLMSLYHGFRFSDRAFGNLMSSLVVFDEVHAYDATTLNAIREGLEVLRLHSIPAMFMSATLPSSRRHFFGLDDRVTVIEKENAYRPFIVERVDAPLTVRSTMRPEASETARSLLHNARGLKLAVYVNQVERAKALARAAKEELPGTRVFCYHSELAPKDRVLLEEQIISAFREEAPVALFATQAAELSLDISADRMITELAPADVLVQRAGRLHRRGLEPVQSTAASRVPVGFVYRLQIAPLLDEGEEPESASYALLPYKDSTLLLRTWETAPWGSTFDFEIGLKWCEAALNELPRERDTGLLRASRVDAVFGNLPQVNYGEDEDAGLVVIRDRDEETRLVVPEIYVSSLTDALREVAKHQVPISRRKFFSLKQAGLIEERFIPIVLYRGHRKETHISYPIHVVKSCISYDPNYVGFDIQISENESAAQLTGDNILG